MWRLTRGASCDTRCQIWVARWTAGLIVVAAAASCGGNVSQISAAISPILAAAPVRNVPPAVWTDVRAFYATRRGAPAWVDRDSPASPAKDAIALLQRAREHGLAPDRYDQPALAELERTLQQKREQAKERDATLAAFDVRLTTALLSLGRDVAIGVAGAEPPRGRWQRRRQAPDLAGTLVAGTW